MVEEQNQAQELKPSEMTSVPEIPPELRTPAAKKSTPHERFVPPLGNARELAGIGLEITGSMIGLGALGWGADLWLGSSPWGIAIGLVLGIMGGMYNAIRKTLKFTNSSRYENHYKKRHHNPSDGETRRGEDSPE